MANGDYLTNPRLDIPDELDMSVTYRDRSGRQVPFESDERFLGFHQWLGYDEEVYKWLVEHHEVEKSDYFIAQETTAREYWAAQGFEDMPDVLLLEDDEFDYLNYSKVPTTIARYDPLFNVVTVRNKRINELLAMGDENVVATTLVHEFTHATMKYDQIGVNVDKNDELWYSGRKGFSILAREANAGSFYEEGYAVYKESAFLRSLNGNSDVLSFEGVPSIKLPESYQKFDQAMTGGPDGYAMELIAYGLAERGVMTAEQFIQLLDDTRKPKTQTLALRAFAQAVETLERGLYPKLRDLEYGKTNWIGAYTHLHKIVTAGGKKIA